MNHATMNNFEANLLNDKEISIVSDTTWEAYAVGNFKLSKYFGKGDDTINVIIPESIYKAEGTVHFKYGDEKCIYPTIDIIAVNECFLETIPKFVICDTENGKQKILFLYYNDDKEMLNFKLSPYMDNWNIIDNGGFTIFEVNNNIFIVVSKGEDGEIIIKIGESCDDLHVKIVKNPNQ